MALPEVCSLWIEQRVAEESDSEKSGREIGRIIAAEVEKYFKVKVSPESIRQRSLRMVQSEPPTERSEESTTNTGFEKTLKKSAKTENRGGAREGSGRKGKAGSSQAVTDHEQTPPTKQPVKKANRAKVIPERSIMSDHFKRTYKDLAYAIGAAKNAGWKETTQAAAAKCIENLSAIADLEITINPTGETNV